MFGYILYEVQISIKHGYFSYIHLFLVVQCLKSFLLACLKCVTCPYLSLSSHAPRLLSHGNKLFDYYSLRYLFTLYPDCSFRSLLSSQSFSLCSPCLPAFTCPPILLRKEEDSHGYKPSLTHKIVVTLDASLEDR